LIYDSVYGHSVSTHGLFLSFCLSTLCTYSLIVYSELVTFLCINLIWFIYCILITNYYYMYYCSDLFFTLYVVIYWQVLYPLWWIAGILNKWLLWLWLRQAHSPNHCCRGEAIRIAHSECVSVASDGRHQSACAVLHAYCHLCPVWHYLIFPHYHTNGIIFGKIKKSHST